MSQDMRAARAKPPGTERRRKIIHDRISQHGKGARLLLLPGLMVHARKLARSLALIAGVLAVGIQLVPYGRDHQNPPVVKEPNWNNSTTRALAARACFDCHSNQTVWPWYSTIAPVSWLVQHDVDEGRRALNFSEWHRAYEEAGEAADSVREGEMPLIFYGPLHPAARLSAAEKSQLADGLSATIAESQHRSEERD